MSIEVMKRIKSLLQDTKMIDSHTISAVVAECDMAILAQQPAMVTGECRGGFSAGELIAFLYARSFPKTEWRARVDEAFKGAENL